MVWDIAAKNGLQAKVDGRLATIPCPYEKLMHETKTVLVRCDVELDARVATL